MGRADQYPISLNSEQQEERDLLMRELERIGTIDQSTWGLAGAMLSFLVAAMIGFFIDGGKGAAAGATSGSDGRDGVLILITLVLIAAGSYLVIIFSQQVIQSYYTRDIESRLAHLLRPALTSEDRISIYENSDEIELVAVAENLAATYVSNRRGVRSARYLFLLVVGIVVVAVIAVVGVLSSQIQQAFMRGSIQIIATVSGLLAMRLGWRSVVRGPALWHEVKQNTLVQVGLAEPKNPAEALSWELPKYILLPRRTEILVKGVMLHLSPALVGIAFAWDNTSAMESLGAAVVSFVSFEWLLYQARYMVNDFRGYDEDQLHPAAQSSRSSRLPSLWRDQGGSEPARWIAFWLVFVLRSVAPFLIVWWLIPQFMGEFYVAFGVAIVAAVVYEVLRSVGSSGTGYTRASVALYATVGISYGVRISLGFLIGSNGHASGTVLVALGLALYFGGMSTVLATWALESSQYVVPERAQSWYVSRDFKDQSLGAAHYNQQALGTKRHLLPLGVSAHIFVTAATAEPPPSALDPETTKHVLERLESTKFLDRLPWQQQPFSIVIPVAIAAGAVAGWAGRHGIGTKPTVGELGVVAVVGLAVGVAVAAKSVVATPVLCLGVITMILLAWRGVIDRGLWFVLVPATVVAVNYMVSRGLTYKLTQKPLSGVADLLKAAGEALRSIAR